MKSAYGISKIALGGILQKPFRSFLTMLTTAIGIASVIATIAVLDGANDLLYSNLTNLGTRIIVIQNKDNIKSRIRSSSKASKALYIVPGMSRLLNKRPLDVVDVKRLEEEYADENILVAPGIVVKMNFTGPDGVKNRLTVIGTSEKYFKMISTPLIAGRVMTAEEAAAGDNVCMIDEAIVYRLFSSEASAKQVLGKKITLSIDNKPGSFRIVGVLKDPYSLRKKNKRRLDIGSISRAVQYSRMEYKNIYVPFPVLEGGKKTGISTIFIVPEKLDDVESLTERVKAFMSSRKKDVHVWDQKTWIFAAYNIIEELTSFSHYIWIIILTVAMIMIITITLVSVRERFHEIAIRITEGATKYKIMVQFSIESLYLSVLGGIAGTGLGFLFVAILERWVIRWDAPISPRVILFALVISIVLGILTSIPTAKRAASLNPIDVFRMH